jgi:PleD family two-component response regulator
MKDENTQNYDLPAVFRLGNLDIQRVIRNNRVIKVGDYFNLLTKFCDHASMAIDSMDKIISLKADENDISNMEIMNTILEDIGNIVYFHDIDDIVKTGNSARRGHEDSAAELTQKIYDSLKGYCTRVMATKKADVNIDKTQYLKDYISQVEKEETERKLQILAVDDAPVVLKTILSVLGEIYKVHIMPDPLRVEKFLQQITPDLIILDYQMPGLNGFELIPIIRKFDEHKHTPIIFLTSEGTGEHVAEAHNLGACDFMVKPFQGNQLIEKVAKHIVKKKMF